MPKAIFVISGLGAGGAERVISQIATHWHARGIEVQIASFDVAGDAEFHDFGTAIKRHRLGRATAGAMSSKLTKLHNLRDLRKLLRRERPDVVLPFLTKNNLLTLIASLGLAIPVICCERNNPERQDKHPAWNALLAFAYRRACLIVCQTDAVRRCFSPNLQDRLRVVPNPVSAWPQPRRKTGELLHVTAVGRLTEQKGFDILLDAYAAIGSAAAGTRLLLYGEGPLRDALEDRIAELGISDRVQLMGNSEMPGAWVGNTDLFVLASRYEGFPNVLGEAMASGLPVIASDCEFGPADLVDHGRSGLLVQPENAEALGEAMRECMEDPRLRERLGRNAKQAVGRFAPRLVMRQWDAVLEEALATDATTHESDVNSLEELAR